MALMKYLTFNRQKHFFWLYQINIEAFCILDIYSYFCNIFDIFWKDLKYLSNHYTVN